MYIRFSALLPVAALAAVAAAAPSGFALEERQYSQCSTGSMQCCTTTTTANNPALTGLLGLLGISITDINSVLGIACSPLTGVGTGSGSSCTQQPVCCNNVYQNGLVNVGCSPININL